MKMDFKEIECLRLWTGCNRLRTGTSWLSVSCQIMRILLICLIF